MHELRRRAGGGHGCSDLARDMTGLADPGADHPAGGGLTDIDGFTESVIETLRELAEGIRFGYQDAPPCLDISHVFAHALY